MAVKKLSKSPLFLFSNVKLLKQTTKAHVNQTCTLVSLDPPKVFVIFAPLPNRSAPLIHDRVTNVPSIPFEREDISFENHHWISLSLAWYFAVNGSWRSMQRQVIGDPLTFDSSRSVFFDVATNRHTGGFLLKFVVPLRKRD